MKRQPLSLWFTSNEALVYGVLLFSLVIFLPLFFWPGLYNEYFGAKTYLYWISAIGLTIAAWLWRGKLIIPGGSKMWWLIGLCLAAGSFSSWVGGDVATSWWGVFSRGEYSLFSTVVTFLLVIGLWTVLHKAHEESPHQSAQVVSLVIQTLIVTLTVLLFIFSIIEFIYFPGRNGYVDGGVIRLTLSYPNPIFLSYVLAPIVSFLFVFVVWSRSTRELIMRLIPFVMATLILVWTYTRAAWLVTAAAIGIITILSLWLQRTRQALLNVIIVALVMVIVVALHWSGIRARNTDFVDKGSSQILEDLSRITGKDIKDIREFYPDQSAVQNLTSSDIRLLEMRWGWQLYTRSWSSMLWGYGPESEFRMLPEVRPSLLNYLPTDANTKPYYIRNWYLHILLTTGAAGLLVVVVPQLVLGVAVLRWLWVRRKAIRDEHNAVVIILGLTAAVIAFAGYGFLYTSEISAFAQYILYLTILGWLLVRGTKSYVRVPKGRFAWIAIVVSACLLVPVIRLAMFDYYFAQSTNRQATTAQALVSASKAQRWWPYGPSADRAISSLSIELFSQAVTLYSTINPVTQPPSVPLAQAWEQMQSGSITHHQGATILHTGSLDSLNRLKSLPEADSDTLRVLASSYYRLVRLDRDNKSGFSSDRYLMQDARRFGYRSIAADPSLPVPYDDQGLQELYIHNLAEAERLFNKAIELKSDYWFSYLHLGELYRQRCQPAKALEYYEKAKPYVPLAEGEISEAGGELRNLELNKKCQYNVWTKDEIESIKVGQKLASITKKFDEPHLWIDSNTAEYYATTGECRQITLDNGVVKAITNCQVVK